MGVKKLPLTKEELKSEFVQLMKEAQGLSESEQNTLFEQIINGLLNEQKIEQDHVTDSMAPGTKGRVAGRIFSKFQERSQKENKPMFRMKANFLNTSTSTENANQLKKERGRPPKNTAGYQKHLRCLQIADEMGITDIKTRTLLTQIAEKALISGSAGIPQTLNVNSYKTKSRGGPRPVDRVFLIDNERHEVSPPIVVKGGNKQSRMGTLAAWVEFEKVLLNISELYVSRKTMETMQAEILKNKGLAYAGISPWLEEPVTNGTFGIPTIGAETARDILRTCKDFKTELGEEYITNSPSCWVNKKGEYDEKLSKFIRDVWYGKKILPRKGRFAMARLLMTSLSQIEKKIMEIGFQEKYEDKKATLQNLEVRSNDFGRRKSRKKSNL